ncbi:MAG: hypothetical protein E6J90_26460 [Deltaproteobacteria bacterium]|nr:MAG: hypothetical protein E6J91_51830 [Deltaproteobacteria bacterium]TMQ14668.1 MAG: hypothetical protein E6J90_26460 [Deltaproteobacteria bacterium]
MPKIESSARGALRRDKQHVGNMVRIDRDAHVEARVTMPGADVQAPRRVLERGQRVDVTIWITAEEADHVLLQRRLEREVRVAARNGHVQER